MYHVVLFLKIPHLLELKLALEICASWSGGRFVASNVKMQRLRPAIEDGQVFCLLRYFEKVWKMLLALYEAIICFTWNFYE